jgi:hypothetical protein
LAIITAVFRTFVNAFEAVETKQSLDLHQVRSHLQSRSQSHFSSHPHRHHQKLHQCLALLLYAGHPIFVIFIFLIVIFILIASGTKDGMKRYPTTS